MNLRIIHIIPNLNTGGAERLVLDICNEIKTYKDHRVELITFSDNNEYSHLTKNIKWHVIHSKFSPSILKKNMINLEKLQQFIIEFEPDIIHSHLWGSKKMGVPCLNLDKVN